MTYTVHTITQNEVKGKASNVSYAVERFQQILPEWVDFNKLILTIMDCDSICPKEYPDQVNQYLYKNPTETHNVVFNPPQIFKRNDLNVPIFTRSFDNYHAFAHCNSSVSLFQFSSPFSNYTLSYNLIKQVGFWDKNGQALSEDMHTFSKVFWKTAGRVKCIPIFTPFNQLNLQQPGSYLSNVAGKWNQTLRHSYGIHEVSYNIFEFSASKRKTFRGLCYVYYFIDIMLIHNCFTTPLVLFYNLTNLLGSANPHFLREQLYMQLVIPSAVVVNMMCLATF